MQNLIETFKNICEKKEISLQQSDDTTLRTGFASDNGDFDTYIDIYDKVGQITVRTILPIKATQAKCLQVAEVITLANVQVRYGCFELSAKTGHCAYKTNIMLGKADLHEDIVEHLIEANWFYTDYYFPAISSVIFGNISPQEAMDELTRRKDTDQDFPKEQDTVADSINISKILHDRMKGFTNN